MYVRVDLNRTEPLCSGLNVGSIPTPWGFDGLCCNRIGAGVVVLVRDMTRRDHPPSPI